MPRAGQRPEQANDIDSFSMLWNAMIGGVNDLESDLVRGPRDAAELLHDVVQSRAMLQDEALDILQEERSGSFRGQCCNNVIYY